MTAAERLRSNLDSIARSLVVPAMDLSPHLVSGKLLRRRLVLTVAGIAGRQDDESSLQYAAQVELIHAGALIHDDIMDGSTQRRRRSTLWAETDVRSAAYTGLGLMAQAAGGLAFASGDLRHQVADLVREVARGQTDELAHTFVTSVSPERYLRRAQAKTGALYELAARLGAAAGALDPPTTDAVAQFAALLGLGFQLADDVRDLLGGPALGRAPGTDLRVGVYTLPVLATLAGRFSGGDRLRALLAEADARSYDESIALLCENGAVDHTMDRARALVAEAIGRLSTIPSQPARTALEEYAHDLLGPLGSGGERIPLMVLDAPSNRGSPALRKPNPTDPVATVALHPTLPQLVCRATRSLAGRGDLHRAVATAVALIALADGCGSDRPDSFDLAAQRRQASLIGAIDLLLSDLWVRLASLPPCVAAVTAKRLADFALQHAQSARAAPLEAQVVDDESLARFVDGIAMEIAGAC